MCLLANAKTTAVLSLTLALAGAAASCLPTADKFCTSADDCNEGRVCVDGGGEQKECASPCAADARCPSGAACVEVDGALEGACLGTTGDANLGDACAEDRSCASGACADELCVKQCSPTADASSDPGCGDGEVCALDGLRYVCVPSDGDKPVGDACASSTECAEGTCVLRTGETAAVCAHPCADESACEGGDTCVRLVGGAKACMTPIPDGVSCTDTASCAGGFCLEDVDGTKKCASACDAGTCAEGFSCTKDGDANDVCMPILDDRGAGEACETARQCESGQCAHFATPEQDFGTICADVCGPDGLCGGGLVCWAGRTEEDADVCGPQP